MEPVHLLDARVPPPALSGDTAESAGATVLPWVLLESKAHIADRCNATTAYCDLDCGKQIQVTFCIARPPRVSYLCVFSRAAGGDQDWVIPWDPKVLATEGNIVLLRIPFGTKDGGLSSAETDLFIYRPGGHEGPSLTLLKRPPGDRVIACNDLGLLTFRQDNQAGNVSFLRPHKALEDESYMVAALCDDDIPGPPSGHFVLYLYNSKHETWSTTMVSLEEDQLRQYQKQGSFFLHQNFKVIAIGGDHDTVGFVDLWRGILICDLARVLDHPKLRYIPLPREIVPDGPILDDARLYRDIAVIQGRIRCFRMGNYLAKEGWVATSWSRTSSLEDTWRKDYEIESTQMDVGNPQYELIPKPHQQRGPPFKGFCIMQPVLSLQNGDATFFFTVKTNYGDAKAWVVSVDMMENKLQAVVEFDSSRYTIFSFAYLHSGISKYLTNDSGAAKGSLKRRGSLWQGQGSSNKKQPPEWLMKHFAEQDAESYDENKMNLD